ncbi:MAG: GGDEF domain-containing protein, partial [Oscillospiraceae bacterium]|nr:GGDEF domain-containing protein [Oscillospiraceae bacterium]
EIKLDSYLKALEGHAHAFENINKEPYEARAGVLFSLVQVSGFQDLVYIDTGGLAVSAHHNNVENLSARPYFRSAIDGFNNVSGIIISAFDNTRTNVFAVPVYTEGKITGVLAGTVSADDISALMSSDTFNNQASSYIMDSTGSIVLASHNNILNLDSDISLFDYVEMVSDKEKVLVDLHSGNPLGSFSFKMNGEEFYATYKAIGIGDWAAVTMARSNDIYVITSNVFNMMFIFTLMFLVITSAGIIIVGARHWVISNKYAETVTERDYFKFTDTLTGGSSYEKFLTDVSGIFEASESGVNYAMISVDIDKFRTVNDHLGHDEGSKILIKLSQIIQNNLSDDETYTRKNADLFYILLKYDTDTDIFGRIKTIINDSYYQIEDFKLILLFGIYKIEDVQMDIRSIIDCADLARRTIKDSSDSTYAFFDSKMLSKIREEKRIENLMEFALESNEFKVYLQPKYDLQNRKEIIGAEALIRWFRDGKMIPPGGFIPIFEKNGFILKTDLFVFEEVCKQQKTWLSHGYEMRVISVNMSRVNVQHPNFVRNLYDICTKYNVPTKYFEIEITESVAFENLEVLTRVFNELKNYGFHISIDDFGTGYSSLNMLKNLPVDVLKLDRAFLSESGKNERANSIIKHIIQLALSLHMKTICEGIETNDQATLLSELGCDMAQGFYFARPMPIEDYEKLLYGNELDARVTK